MRTKMKIGKPKKRSRLQPRLAPADARLKGLANERTTIRLAGMYAALGATNEAIIRSTSPDELYQRVCDAAVHGGKFITVAILIPDADTAWANVAAITGGNAEKLRALRISVDEAAPEGRGLVGTAFRTVKPCVSNDHLNDERTQPWRREATEMGVASAAAIPLVRNKRAIGVLLLDSGEKKTFDNEVVTLFERIAENVVFALDNFDREAERRRTEDARQRFTRMYAALSDTNEAIMRATSPDELFQLVCDAAVHGGKFNATSVFLVQPESQRLKLAASTGIGTSFMRGVHVSTDATRPEGRGLVGSATRSCKPSICNDLDSDENMRPWADARKTTGSRAGAALPIRRAGRTIGALAFYSRERGAFDDEVVKLLERMAANLSFALDNFDRETEREHAETASRESEEKHRAVLENMSEGYFEVDLTGNYTFFNDALARLHGYTREEMVGLNYRQYAADEETAQRVYEVYNEVYRSGKSVPLHEWSFIRKDGSRGMWEQSVQLIVGALGEPVGFRGVPRHSRKHERRLL
jgi:PAS domain S-box-containing protein